MFYCKCNVSKSLWRSPCHSTFLFGTVHLSMYLFFFLYHTFSLTKSKGGSKHMHIIETTMRWTCSLWHSMGSIRHWRCKNNRNMYIIDFFLLWIRNVSFTHRNPYPIATSYKILHFELESIQVDTFVEMTLQFRYDIAEEEEWWEEQMTQIQLNSIKIVQKKKKKTKTFTRTPRRIHSWIDINVSCISWMSMNFDYVRGISISV